MDTKSSNYARTIGNLGSLKKVPYVPYRSWAYTYVGNRELGNLSQILWLAAAVALAGPAGPAGPLLLLFPIYIKYSSLGSLIVI
jgi:hypothetical protein